MRPISQDERERFILYLEEDAASLEAILGQMQKIGTPEILQSQYRAEMQASRIVAAKLRSSETQELR